MPATTTNVVELPPPAPTTPLPGGTLTAGQLVDKLLRIRNKVAEIKDGHKKELEKFNEAEAYFEGRLLEFLNQTGVRSMRTPEGTFYTQKATSVRVDAWSQTLRFIIDNQAWELLEARVNKSSAMGYIEQTTNNIPGVNVTSIYELHVRKPTKGEA